MTFRAMSVDITILGSGVSPERLGHAGEQARIHAEWWESLFSRFRPSSLLCRLNAASGTAVSAPSAFMDVLERAKTGVLATSGAFDPAMLPALEAAGYDRDFDLVRSGSSGAARDIAGASRFVAGPDAWELVEIDRAAWTVRLPAGMRVDLGGIAKGGFVDLVADRLASWPGGLVDAGGDLRVWGCDPDGGPWRVAIENPLDPEHDIALVTIVEPARAGGVATSGVLRRQWGADSHHLIDPRAGRPVADGLAAVTVFAATCAEAEIATKTLMVGSGRGADPASHDPGVGAAFAVGVSRSGERRMMCEGDLDAVELEIPLDAVAAGDHRA